MFRHMLVPLDGSPHAEAALPVAAQLAQASGGTIACVHVVNPQTDLVPYVPSDLEVVQCMIHDEEVAACSYLHHLTQENLSAGVAVETTVLCGSPAACILSEGQARQIDLIVLCSHGSGSGEGQCRALGDVAEEIVQHAAVPVLLLP